MTLHAGGTRVRLFPELFAGYREPETAFLSPRPGSVGAGPQDRQMYVANAVDKRQPYAPPDYMPPYQGAEHRPAMPDAGGHFDTIPVATPQFLAAHLYGTARHTLDIWEYYLGQEVRWWHAPAIPRLELVPLVDWPNAQSGPGFLETGAMLNRQHQRHLFCLNFDVVAHEVGHAVLFATVGVPAPDRMTGEYLAFHESFSDLFGLIGVLRFDSVIRRLLAQTQGNLHTLNLVDRLGAYSDSEQIRVAANSTTMADVAGLRLRPDGDWEDPSGRHRNQHDLGEPLTGVIFDVMVEIFQNALVARGVLGRDMDLRGATLVQVAQVLPALQLQFERSYRRSPGAYYEALLEARDVVGFGMAHAMRTLHPETLSFGRVAACLVEAAFALGQRASLPAILRLFQARGIDPVPFLDEAGGVVRLAGGAAPRDPSPGDPQAFLSARRLIRHAHREHPR